MYGIKKNKKRKEKGNNKINFDKMKIILVYLFTIECFILLQCLNVNVNAYKIFQNDQYPKRFQSRSLIASPVDDLDDDRRLVGKASLFHDVDEIRSYERALAALAEAAQDENNENDDNDDEFSLNSESSNEYNLEDLLNSKANLYDEIELTADPRDEESESHSSLVAGHQYVSGGAGEGKQHLLPDGSVDNKEEVKSDEDLPAYCDPPNPCPLGYKGDDCDPRPYSEYTAEFSKNYQDQQNCMCDDDHNECGSSKSAKTRSNQKLNDLIQNIQNLQISKPDVVLFLFYILNNFKIFLFFFKRNSLPL